MMIPHNINNIIIIFSEHETRDNVDVKMDTNFFVKVHAIWMLKSQKAIYQ